MPMGGDILEIMNDIHLSIIMAYLHWEGRQHDSIYVNMGDIGFFCLKMDGHIVLKTT